MQFSFAVFVNVPSSACFLILTLVIKLLSLLLWSLHLTGTPIMRVVCQSSVVSSTGFAEGLIRNYVFNVLIMPGETKSLAVRFSPISNRSVSSLLVIR